MFTPAMQRILEEIEAERRFQVRKWGYAHDDKHSVHDWVAILTRYSGSAAKAAWPKVEITKVRGHLLKMATVAVAALEAIDRAAARETPPGRGESDPKEE